MKNIGYFFICLIVGTVVAGCGAQATVTPEPTATATQTPSPSATPTTTTTVTPTLTPSPTATETPTPKPTATPMGYYQSDVVAIALVLPPGFEVLEEQDNVIFFGSESTDIYGYLISYLVADSEELSYEGELEYLLNYLGASDYELLSQSEYSLRDGTTGTDGLLDAQFEDGQSWRGRLLMFRTETRGHLIFLIGPIPEMDAKASSLERMLDSVQLGSATVAGYPRAETLVLLGYEPYPEDLDPARMTDSAAEYAGHIFAGLVRFDTHLQIVPDLAQEWTTSPDGTRYTFRLRDGLTFQNGDPLTAEDVKYSWERATDPEMDSPTAGTYLGDIVGVKEKLNGEADEIAGVKVIDELTLEVLLDAPKPYFLAKLSYPVSYVVDRENVEAWPEDWMFRPNASGPYTLAKIQPQQSVVLERNPQYHAPAKIEQVIYLLYETGNSLSLFQSGEVDIIYLYPEEAQLVMESDHPDHESLLTGSEMCTWMLMLNNTRAPMDDIQVRRALTLAMDKDRMIEVLTEGMSSRAEAILPPAMPGYSQALAEERSGETAFDPQAARAALDASSYAGDLPEIRLVEQGYGDYDDPYLNLITSMWEETLGIQVTVEYVDPLDSMRAEREAEGHIVDFGWCADYPDPENFLDLLFHSGSEYNVAGYSNGEVDALLEEARTTTDPQARLAIYQEVERLLMEDYAVIPLMRDESYVLVNPRVEGFVLTPVGVRFLDGLRLGDN
jgi:oligopeptide transport system substrate-binding protein